MAPRPQRKPKPIPDRASQLLAEREQDYQAALHIFRNDVTQREEILNQLSSIGIPEEKADEALAKMVADTRRGRRDAVSEGSMLFENDLRNYAIGLDNNPVGSINKTEAGQRKVSQPIPGTEAHHPASVSSTESLVQNMDEYETRKLWQIAQKNGYTVGSQAKGFIPLSKPAHTTGGRNWGSDFAHVGADGATPDPGRFKTNPLPKGTTAEQAWKALQPILEEQRVLNEKAYNHPVEARMRADAESTLGRTIEWRGPVTDARALSNKDAKSKGVNATTITQAYDRSPGLLKTNEVPNVTIAVPGAGKVPRSLGKPNPLPTESQKLTAQQIRYFNAGGGQAGMLRDGLSRDEVIARGQSILSPKAVYNNKPQPIPGALSKPAVKSNKPPTKPLNKRPRGTAGVQLTDIAPPSTERFGPGGMFSTIDQLHEKQFQWRN